MKKSLKQSLLYSQIIFLVFIPLWIELTIYLHPLVIVIVWFCLTSLFLFIICWKNKVQITISMRFIHIIALIYSTGLMILLFFRPKSQSYGTLNLIPFNTIRFYLSGNVDWLVALYNLGANIALFIPFGLYYRYFKRIPSMKLLFLITIFTISTIETLQFLTKRGSLDVDDLILNVIGVFIGYWIFPSLRKVLVVRHTRLPNEID